MRTLLVVVALLCLWSGHAMAGPGGAARAARALAGVRVVAVRVVAVAPPVTQRVESPPVRVESPYPLQGVGVVYQPQPAFVPQAYYQPYQAAPAFAPAVPAYQAPAFAPSYRAPAYASPRGGAYCPPGGG